MPLPRPRAEPLRRARAPPPTAPSRGGRVQQRVLLSYTAEGTRCELKIRGTALRPDKVLGVDTFGLSAPGDQVFEAKGITVPKLVALAK